MQIYLVIRSWGNSYDGSGENVVKVFTTNARAEQFITETKAREARVEELYGQMRKALAEMRNKLQRIPYPAPPVKPSSRLKSVWPDSYFELKKLHEEAVKEISKENKRLEIEWVEATRVEVSNLYAELGMSDEEKSWFLTSEAWPIPSYNFLENLEYDIQIKELES